MSETIYEVKRSKSINIFMWILVFLWEILFGGFIIFVIISIVREDYKTFENPISQLAGDIVGLIFSILLFCLVMSIAIYLTIESKKQVDVYTENKMYQKIGNKIKFEIEYANIESVKESYFNCLLLFCKKGFIKSKSKHIVKPQTMYMEFYTQKDITKIVQLISEFQNKQE